MAYSIDSLEVADNPIVLFRGIVGSRAYGTQNANSDMDVRGIFVVPSAEYARLAQPPKQVADERNDRTYYSLVRFCELMSEANPTTMEMLFLPDDCIMKTSPAHSMLVANRGLFVTQKAVDSHLGYALSQIKKARGTNKRVWNPWPEEPPQAEDYCLFLGDAKGRAVPVRETELNLARCKVTRLVGNRAADMFALYDYGAPTGGIFHGGMLVETGAADLDREKRIGILISYSWAFEGEPDTLKSWFKKIPDGLDVLVTHSPPRIPGRDVDRSLQTDSEHFGSPELTEAILEKRPRLVFCGHIHSGQHGGVDRNRLVGTMLLPISVLGERGTGNGQRGMGCWNLVKNGMGGWSDKRLP